MESRYSIESDQICIEYFGDSCSADDICGDHCHDVYEIIYMISASGKYIVEGSEHFISRGTVMLIKPFSFYRVEIDKSYSLEGYSIKFKRSAVLDKVCSIFSKIIDQSGDNGIYYALGTVSNSMFSVFDKLSVANGFKEEEKGIYLELLLSEIIIHLSAANGERIVPSEEPLGARVAKYLNLNIERNLSLDRIAKRFFVSKYYLCRAFKDYSGISVHSYINHKRIMYAKQLIESGVTAAGAAERVGFGDYSAFYRAYVKIVGKSPTRE